MLPPLLLPSDNVKKDITGLYCSWSGKVKFLIQLFLMHTSLDLTIECMQTDLFLSFNYFLRKLHHNGIK